MTSHDAPSSAQEAFGIRVSFKSGLRTDGDAVVWMTIRQNDVEVTLTEEQAESLATQINRRVSP